MDMEELDALLQKNEDRINQIKERFEIKRQQTKTAKDLINEEKETFETKEHFKDNSLSYPSYGRGLVPNIEMNTFMLQETNQNKNKKSMVDTGEMSPQASVQARQRRKIISPKRLRYENDFEKFMTTKFIEKPVE